MRAGTLGLAVEIIKTVAGERPADRVLREALKTRRDLLEGDAAEVSRAVFAYYRWFGWVRGRNGLAQQVQDAVQLAEKFAREPKSFGDAELVERVLPEELCAEIPVNAKFARALQAEPRIWLRARPGQGTALAKRLGFCRAFGAGALSDTLEYLGKRDLFRTQEFHAGQFELQDLSSQCVGLICDPKPGETWWDACAGEGGKLLHLSDLMQNKGLIWASDRAAWRLQKMKRRSARAGVFNYRSAPWDGGSKLPTRTRFDGVLLDAPCTGAGTWHRNPHARWTTTLRDVKELAALQLQLITHASQALKPGARLVYSVCTPTRSETLGLVERFQQECPHMEALAISNPLQRDSPASLGLTIKLEETGGNGMFIAAWRLNSKKQNC